MDDVSTRRLAGLDGMRALAVSLVVVAHATPHFAGGGIGVCMFFVLSGYLITSLLAREQEKTGSIHLRLFYVRRALRLWPALLVMLAVTVALGAPISSAAIAATYLTDISSIFGHGAEPYLHTWSLGVEEQFYVLWPLLLPLALRRTRAGVWALLVCATLSLIGCWLWTLHSLHTTGVIGIGVFNPLWQGHGLLIGCALALAGHRIRAARPEATAAAAGVLTIGIAVAASITVNRHWATWWDLLSELLAVMLIVALRDARKGVFTSRVSSWLGRRSYAIYLWQLPLVRLLQLHRVEHGEVLALIGTLAAAELSARFVEAPFLRIKDRLHPSEATAPRPRPPDSTPTADPRAPVPLPV
jgi:peptidoglycan/LPS O-acetylase OafA/YrhL